MLKVVYLFVKLEINHVHIKIRIQWKSFMWMWFAFLTTFIMIHVFVFALCICICIMYLHCEFVFALCVFVCAIGISDKDWVECQLIPTRICPEFQPPTHHLLLDIIILVNSKLGAGMQHQNSGIVKILKVHGIARHNLGHHLFCIGPQIATTATLALFLKLAKQTLPAIHKIQGVFSLVPP